MTLVERTAHITYLNMPYDLRGAFHHYTETGLATPANLGKFASRALIHVDEYGSHTLTDEGVAVRDIIIGRAAA